MKAELKGLSTSGNIQNLRMDLRMTLEDCDVKY